ncbi:HNH endonuclease [Streptomyces naphthomycinicus]|uniref:HNH endonuclease n=1 Tax=Streptomyces naphthomycinicus TaxID=2872625 RepID=UPI001CEC113B|nr:HNH endonuclease [Streptomyces sp. TML10]
MTTVAALSKQCLDCKQTKPLDDFTKLARSKDGRREYCRPCSRARNKRWKQSKATPCTDCGSLVSRAGIKRCRPCTGKRQSGSNHYAYKGGRHTTPGGYIYLSGHHDHPNANAVGQIAEHVLVMSQTLGRPLHKGENVHHKNGDRADNRPENLELWSRVQPPGQRVEDKVAWAIEILQTYRPELLKEQA